MADAVLSAKKQAILELIISNKVYQNYFFSKVSEISWFYVLKEKGFFSPNEEPAPIEGEEAGTFRIPEWNVLQYLERVSQQIDGKKNVDYADELLKIIDDVSRQPKDNYRTYWFFVKILVNIPCEVIPLEILMLIPNWLSTRFGNELVGMTVATKLLPKVLESDDVGKAPKAELILSSITDIKWQRMPETKQRGLFGREKEAYLAVDYHTLEEILISSNKSCADKIGQICSIDTIYDLALKLSQALGGESEHHIDPFIGETQFLLGIRQMGFNQYHFTAKRIWQSKTKNELLHDFFSESAPDFELAIEVIDRESFALVVKPKFAEHFGLEAASTEIDECLQKLFDAQYEDYSHIWLDSLFQKNNLYDAKQVLTAILFRIATAKAIADDDAGGEIVDHLLTGTYRYSIFTRIAVGIIGTCWEKYSRNFWNWIEENEPRNIFNDSDLAPEIYGLLKMNREALSEIEIKKIIEIVESGPTYIPEEVDQGLYSGYWKQLWYSALLERPEINKMYEQIKSITNADPVMNFGGSSVRSGPGSSPLSKEDVLALSNREIAEIIIGFKAEDPWDGPSVEGLSSTIGSVANENPGKFIVDMDPFMSVGFIYISEMLRGFSDAWKNHIGFDWDRLLAFLSDYTNQDAFWEDGLVTSDSLMPATHLWVVGGIGTLIQEGSKETKWAIPEIYHREIFELIFDLINKTGMPEKEDANDYVTHALNSPCGKLLLALSDLAFTNARAQEKPEEAEWEKVARDKYDLVLDDGILDAFAVLGDRLPRFFAIDEKWVVRKISDMRSLDDYSRWEAFMDGYSYNSVYKSIYKLMEPHYLKAVGYEFNNKRTIHHLIDHIAIGYLNGLESISDASGRIIAVLEKWAPNQICEMIDCFRRAIVETNEEGQKKIVEFWQWIYENKLENCEEFNEDDKKIMSRLLELTVYLPTINTQNTKWIIKSAQVAVSEYRFVRFLEDLDRFSDKASIDNIAGIMESIKHELHLIYDQDHVESLVIKLYENGHKDIATNITEIYGEKGNLSLRSIREKYDPYR